VVSFTSRQLYPRGKSRRYPLDWRLGEPQNRSGRRGEEKNPAPTGTPNSDPSAVRPVASRCTAMFQRDESLCSMRREYLRVYVFRFLESESKPFQCVVYCQNKKSSGVPYLCVGNSAFMKIVWQIRDGLRILWQCFDCFLSAVTFFKFKGILIVAYNFPKARSTTADFLSFSYISSCVVTVSW
jgi:hypothetical protein